MDPQTIEATGILLIRLASLYDRALMLLLGSQSRREVLRTRHRVLAAMHVQSRVQGRFLGGRPPDGYSRTDASPTSCDAADRSSVRTHVRNELRRTTKAERG
ncbi:hypothetical protein [Amycolatopsis sp. CA-126428]|uniref:hypothetical protein n=1 Tax=Amycolatopsis sp. CA-126428 TaxID=2073158 RepID=UPI001E2C3742|nr:hypothetical protein [Amycolatopsis sp. CA-126428]